MPKTVLAGLKKYPVEIFTGASMLESGGSSGQLRIDFQTLPWGDLRRHFLALSSAPEWKNKIFQLRVGREVFDGGHKGHPFGNVFLSGLEYILGDLKETLKIAHKFLEVKGHVFPLTSELSHIYATLENGEVVFGEDEIDVPRKHSPKLRIKEVRLTKKIKAYQPVLKVIKEADLIVIGPGDLYSSLIPCFLPKGIKEAVEKSKAKKVYICNLMNKYGETNNFTVSDFTEEIEKYLDEEIDYVIYNTKKPSQKRLSVYKKDHPELAGLVEFDKKLSRSKKFIGKNILTNSGPICHDSGKLAKIILSLCKP